MLYIFGLGNPGKEYEKTRHNVGLTILEKTAALFHVKLRKRCFFNYKIAHINLDGKKVAFVFPLSYMNNSGNIIPKLLKDDDELIVLCDQMDIAVGKIRFKSGKSSAGHNGLKSIMNNYDKPFLRMYCGIGRPKNDETVVHHVLAEFSTEDSLLIDESTTTASEILKEYILGANINMLMQKANTYESIR